MTTGQYKVSGDQHLNENLAVNQQQKVREDRSKQQSVAGHSEFSFMVT